MKTNFLKQFVGASLFLVLLAGCGADKAKKSSSSGTGTVNNDTLISPGVVSNTTASGEVAMTNYLAWYNSTTEGAIPSVGGPIMMIRSIRTFSTSSGCNPTQLSLGGFNFGSISMCFNTSSQSSQPRFESDPVTVYLSGAPKNNAKLIKAADLSPVRNIHSQITQFGSSSTYGAIMSIEQQGTAYIFTTVRSNKVNTVVIDSGINSALNPIYILDNSRGKEDRLIQN